MTKKIKIVFVIFAVCLAALALARYSIPVKEAANKELDQKLAQDPKLKEMALEPVEDFMGRKVVLRSDDNAHSEIHNCYEYWTNAHSAPDYPEDVAVYLERCGPAKMKMDSKPARQTFVKDIKLADKNFLKLLKASDFNRPVGEDEAEANHLRAIEESGLASKSIFEAMSPKEKESVELSEKGKRISFIYDDMYFELTEESRANHDGSGVESILISEEASPVGGSLRIYSLSLYKRNSAEGFLERIPVEK